MVSPVSDAAGEVQAGLLQVGLEAGLPGHAATLRTDVRRFVFVDPLVSGDGAGVGKHHGRRALRAQLEEKQRSVRRGGPHVSIAMVIEDEDAPSWGRL